MATMNKLFLPSMMCADFGHLANDVYALEDAGANGFHLDLMDGTYVPNYGMGLQDIEWICKNSSVPCDVHMMVEQPGRYVSKFADMGVKAGIAINPGTSFAAVEPILPLCDYVLVMTVNPGFAGQKWLDFVNPKIEQLIAASHTNGNNYEVIVDGNCSPERIMQASKTGVKGFVLGTAGLFGHGDFATTMAGLREL